MKKKLSLLFLICSIFMVVCFLNAENSEVITGVIQEVSEDNDYIIVNAIKIMTTEKFAQEAIFEVGDKVEITVEKNDQGIQAVDYKYIFEDEEEEEEEEM
ncbi:hypothetical protein ACFL1T_02965 [Chlamydiota bacterium]